MPALVIISMSMSPLLIRYKLAQSIDFAITCHKRPLLELSFLTTEGFLC